MKILYVLDTYYPKIDGPATVINNMATILTESNLAHTDVLVPYFPKYKDKFCYKVIRCASLPGPDNYRTATPSLSFNLAKFIKKQKYDVIHLHSPFTMARYIIKIAKKLHIPVINTIHTQYKSDFERTLKSKTLQNFMMRYIRKSFIKSDFVLTVSKGFAKDLNNIYKYPKKVNVIRNATEFKKVNDLDEEIKNIKKEYNLDNNFIFLTVGRIVEYKNIQFSLECLSKLKQKGYNNFKFLIVGEGDYKKNLIKLTKEYELDNNVIFTGVVRDRKKLASFYQLSDLFLFPSIADTCGIVVLEAASFGLPSLLIKGSNASELIEDEKNGFVADYNVDDWCQCLEKITNNKKKLTTMKDYITKSLNKSWQDITFEYFNYYKAVILLYKLKHMQKQLFKNMPTIKKAKYNKNKIFRIISNK